MNYVALGRIVMLVGIGTFLIGLLIITLERFGISIGRLPGDVIVTTDRLTCMFPIVSSILVSIIITLLLNFIIRFLDH